MVAPHRVGSGRCPASKTHVDADLTVSVCGLYVYVCVCMCMYCMYVYVLCLYLCFICMYGLDFHSTHHKVLGKHPGEAGPTGLDSVHPGACAHIISQVFGDGARDRFWRTGSRHTRRGVSKHICVATNTPPVGK